VGGSGKRLDDRTEVLFPWLQVVGGQKDEYERVSTSRAEPLLDYRIHSGRAASILHRDRRLWPFDSYVKLVCYVSTRLDSLGLHA
jgi:hypothetical protein